MKQIFKNLANLALVVAMMVSMTMGTHVDAYGVNAIHINDAATQAAATPGTIRQNVGQATDLTIQFTLDSQTTITENETLILTFRSGASAGEFWGNLTTAALNFDDISLTTGAGAQTCAATASATDWGCAVTTDAAAGVDGVITLTAPSNAATYSAVSTEVTVVIGSTTTGAVTLTNPTVNSAAAAAAGEPAGVVEANMYKVTLTGTFGTESGTTHAVKAATILPVLSDDQVHVYAYVAPELTFDLDSGDTNTNAQPVAACAGADDDDDTVCDFFTSYANSIDFGMPSSTAASFATPTHPNFVMDGGTATSNIATGGAHGFHVGTNAANGLVTTVWGETLTNPNGDTIDAIGAAAASSSVGTEQFGFCLELDSNGTYPTSATNTGDALNDAAVAGVFDCSTNGYSFNATANGAGTPVLNTLVTASAPAAMSWFDMEYITNISAVTEAGLYSTDLTFITTALF